MPKASPLMLLCAAAALILPRVHACLPCEGIPEPANPGYYTVATTGEGQWNAGATWVGGQVPPAGANIHVPAGRAVVVNAANLPSYGYIKVDGTLRMAYSVDSKLVCDTIVVTENGTFRVGGGGTTPVNADKVAEVQFRTGDIDHVWDPKLATRGLISEGTIAIHGADKTPYVRLASGVGVGVNSVTLTAAPSGWRVGDSILLTAANFVARPHGTETAASDDEVLTIAAINGSTVTFNSNTAKNHSSTNSGLPIYAANLTRNVRFTSPNGTPIHQRGHLMFMGQKPVNIVGAGFYNLGRTDKSYLIHDPILPASAATSNVRGRYPVHFHKMDTYARTATPAKPYRTEAAFLSKSVIWGSPGWGAASHSSWANMHDNVSYDVFASHFVAEDGDERGQFYRNLAVRSAGDKDRHFKTIMTLRRPNEPGRQPDGFTDSGFNGHGFWFESRNVDVQDNIAVSHQNGAFFYFHRGKTSAELWTDYIRVYAEHMMTPFKNYVLLGRTFAQYNDVPITSFKNNTAVASSRALHVVKANPKQGHDVRNMFENFRGYNVANGVELEYTSRYTLRNLKMFRQGNAGGEGFRGGNVTREVTLVEPEFYGFAKPVAVSSIFEAHNTGVPISVQISPGVYSDVPDLLVVGGTVNTTASTVANSVPLSIASHVYSEDTGNVMPSHPVIYKIASSALTTAGPTVNMGSSPRWLPNTKNTGLHIADANSQRTDSAGLAPQSVTTLGVPSFHMSWSGTIVRNLLLGGYQTDGVGTYVTVVDGVSDRVNGSMQNFQFKLYFDKTVHQIP